MIEERAIVESVAGGTVRIQAIGPHNCPRCAAGQGCGGGLLARMVRRRAVEITATSNLPALSPGDTVIVGLDDGVVLSASVRAYLVPMLCMLGAGGFAQIVLQAHEILVVLFGGAGLAGGLLWLRRISGSDELSTRYRPVILRKDASAGGACGRMP